MAIERISDSGGTGFDACCGVDHTDLCCYNVNYPLQTRLVLYKGREEGRQVERKDCGQNEWWERAPQTRLLFPETRLYVSARRVNFSVNGLTTEDARLSTLAVGTVTAKWVA